MKLSNLMKAFGAAAIVAGLTPYHFGTDEETGGKKVRALFWEAAAASPEEGKKFSIRLGFFNPLKKDSCEAQLFADDLTVDYGETEEKETVIILDKDEEAADTVETAAAAEEKDAAAENVSEAPGDGEETAVEAIADEAPEDAGED